MRSGLIRRHDVPASRVEAAIHLGPHAKTKGVAFFNDAQTPGIYTLPLHVDLPV